MEHTLHFTERSLHTVYLECDIEVSGYVLVNMPVVQWKEMGCPKEIVFSMTPVMVGEQHEKVVA